MNDQQPEWSDVGRAIERRMRQLGLTPAEVIRASGVSFKSLKGYIAGKPIIRRDKARDLAGALGWEADAFSLILAGRPPTVIPQCTVMTAIEADPHLSNDAKVALRHFYRNLLEGE